MSVKLRDSRIDILLRKVTVIRLLVSIYGWNRDINSFFLFKMIEFGRIITIRSRRRAADSLDILDFTVFENDSSSLNRRLSFAPIDSRLPFANLFLAFQL